MSARDAADLKWGAVPREVPVRDLMERIVAKFERLTPEELGRVLAAADRTLGATIAGRDKIASLSSRERQVFELVARGATTEEVSLKLHITKKTVSTHRARINDKLDVHTPAALVAFATLEGIL